jgi:Domain of unknown function (DUF5655)
MRDLWECPACGRRFANTNQSHSCSNPVLEAILDANDPGPVAIFREVVAALDAAGTFRIHPQKTRIAFISRMSFASCRLTRGWVDMGLILPGPVDDSRIRSIDLYGPTSFGHTLRLHAVEDVDETVRGWLGEALRRGDQETLDPHATVPALVGRSLQILQAGARADVAPVDDRLVFRIPRHAVEAFAATGDVDVRIGTNHWPGSVESGAAGPVLLLDATVIPGLGLGEGDHIDVYLTARRTS